jgi:choline-sulfatase
MKELKRLHASLQYIRSRPADGRPWALCMGFSYPHYPQVFTEAAWNRYEGVTIPEPVHRESFHPRNEKWSDDVWGFNRVPPDEVADMRRAYLAMVTMLDDWIGLLMKTLEETGQAENTVVVYTSDHGDMWGEHDLWGKNLFYEESSRVPLIVSAPSLGVEANRHIPTPVSLVDVYPTLRDAAGVTDWPAEVDGRSLWSACRGEETLAEQPVFCDYYASDTKGPERMVRLGRYKLNYYHHWGMELFDLEADPRERTDLADHPDYADIRRRLLEAATADWDPDAVEADIRREQNRKQLVGESMGHRA